MKKAFLINELWIPLTWSKEGVEILVDDPRDLNKTDNIKALMKTGRINFTVAIREDIEKYIAQFFDGGSQTGETKTVDQSLEDFDLMPDVSFEEEEEEALTDDIDEASSQVVKLVDQAIIAAYRKNASDIHIEPSPITKATSIRFRLDGVCQEYMKVPNSMIRGIVSRIKIMSNLECRVQALEKANRRWSCATALLGGVLLIGLVVAIGVAVWRTRVFNDTGRAHHRVLWGLGTFGLIALASLSPMIFVMLFGLIVN